MKLKEFLEFFQPGQSIKLTLMHTKNNKQMMSTDIGMYSLGEYIPKMFLNLEVKKFSTGTYMFNGETYISIVLYEESQN